MKPIILKQSCWGKVREHQYDVAILPWGATEPHNLHLPYGTDTLQAEAFAGKAADIAWDKGAKCMVLPGIPLGVQNPGQVDLPFCLHTSPATQTAILRDILTSLQGQGILKLVVMNSHGGNGFKSIIRELQPEFQNMFIGVIDWFSVSECYHFFDDPGDHAGELETSVMMHCFPEFVLPLAEAGNGEAKGFKLEGLKSKLAWTPRNWSKVSEDTGVGNPMKATKEKGEKCFDFLSDKIAGFLVELAAVEGDDIYE
ncbi:creatininase family protein [Puteibacter caeruleilacunae]|nr:creatininase family protein [Puteibacter caeruleilacunae]